MNESTAFLRSLKEILVVLPVLALRLVHLRFRIVNQGSGKIRELIHS